LIETTMKLLARSPKERHESAHDLLEALRDPAFDDDATPLHSSMPTL